MIEKLQDIIGVLLILGALVLLKRILDSFSGQRPPTKRQRTRRVPNRLPKSPTG